MFTNKAGLFNLTDGVFVKRGWIFITVVCKGVRLVY